MILNLTLHKKWFDMIRTGTKTIEYREVKPYYISRLFDWKRSGLSRWKCIDDIRKNGMDSMCWGFLRTYECILFRNGYRKQNPYFYADIDKIELVNKNKKLYFGIFLKKIRS